MSGYFIKTISVTGESVAPSSVEFSQGMNVIYGPSNTGKSVVVTCIRFMFGSHKAPAIAHALGYDTVSMTLLDDEGKEIRISRKMIFDSEEPRGSSSVTIVSDSERVLSGTYSTSARAKKSYNDVMLQLLGVKERVEVIASKGRTSNMLTVPSFSHQFLLDKNCVTSEKSIIIKPGERNYNDTANINALMFLLTGRAESPTEKDNEQTKNAKKKAVIQYISGVRNILEERQSELEEELEQFADFNAERMIDEVLASISEVEGKIAEAGKESRDITAEIMRLSDSREESLVLRERYDRLKSLYDADVKRLKFILEGEKGIDAHRAEKCPFCSNELTQPITTPSFVEAAKAELDKTRQRIYGVIDAKTDIDDEIEFLESQIEELDRKRQDMQELVNQSYRPRLDELKSILESCDKVTRLRQEIASRKEILKGLEADLGDTAALETKVDQFDAKTYFDKRLFRSLSEETADAIRSCKYPNFRSARLSDKSFDVVVNGKPKSMEGEGFQAFLNSLFAFTLMKFVEANGLYPTRLLMLEAPLLSLKEKVDTPAPQSMKKALVEHFLSECGDSQLIMVENELPEGVDWSSANMIQFTGNQTTGRAGFLMDTREFKDEELEAYIAKEDEEDD